MTENEIKEFLLKLNEVMVELDVVSSYYMDRVECTRRLFEDLLDALNS